MPPLYTRSLSLHSWWSDSNSALVYGPTINLHAAAKPLMRLMYHRQALALIRKNRGKPLSGTTLEIYTSYFQWDFVWWSTKTAILFELAERASDVGEARAVVDSPDFFHITQMLKSPDIGARISSCRLLENLAIHDCTTRAILQLRIFECLVSMLHDGDSGVVERAAFALSRIAGTSLDGARAIVDAGALVPVLKLLESPSPGIREWACNLVGNLACRESTSAAVLALKPFQALVSLLSDKDSGVVDGAAHALSQIAHSSDGAQAIVDAGALDLVLELLESPRNIAWHGSTGATVRALKPYEQIVSLLSDEDSGVVDGAVHALCQIALSLDGAQAITDAGALDHVSTLLESPSPQIRKWSCLLVRSLSSHGSTLAAVLALRPEKQLMTLLRDEDFRVVNGAVHALSQIAQSLDGAQAIVDAGPLGHMLDLLTSPSSAIRKWTCLLVGNLACHESTRAAVLALKPSHYLVSSLRDEDSGIVGWAVHALSRFAQSLDGAQAVVDAGALGHILELLKSPSSTIRKWICLLVGNLASYDSTSASVLALKPYRQIVSLLRDKDPGVVDKAAHASSQFALSKDGAQGIAHGRALDYALGLLESPSSKTRKSICLLVGNLASHESTAAAVLSLKPYRLLVSLTGDEDSEVIEWAVYALSHIARSFEGAQAILNAGVLNRFHILLKSPSFDIWKWTCVLAGALASRHETIEPAGLELKPYKRLASFFQYSPTITRASAMFALCAISERPDGVAALAEPDMVQELHELSHSLTITCLDDELSLGYLHTTIENITRYIDGAGNFL
ncbi:hypothetical protein MVEN_01347000 [Mycena venus]|uniref:ARM repeat-containing protein n=1 Tax=Mycena venus TaxID=2733690 RepID=A0A8H6Y284_9AGAR|nr:hypothetical protein MVEN_01347000 [Mycena venus]